MAFVQSFAQGLRVIRVANPDVKLRMSLDKGSARHVVLVLEYPRVTADPAGRDAWCDTETQDWSRGRAIVFQVKPLNGETLSVSFFDRNNVVYTTWVELRAQEWQAVRIVFEQLRPNPYFQPPDAHTGMPLDVSEVTGLAFAPHGEAAGELMLTPIELEE